MNKVLKETFRAMVIASIRGTTFVFTDKEFDYAGLPMPLIYIMLCVFFTTFGIKSCLKSLTFCQERDTINISWYAPGVPLAKV